MQVRLEKMIVPQMVKKFTVFDADGRLIAVCT
jgi:hypothetical protein